MCDIWRKLFDWLVEVFVESYVDDAGGEVECFVEVRSQSKVCDL